MWKKVKSGFERFWEWLFWREDSDMSFDNSFWDFDDHIPADSRAKAAIFIVLLFIIILPVIFFVIWLDGYLK